MGKHPHLVGEVAVVPGELAIKRFQVVGDGFKRNVGHLCHVFLDPKGVDRADALSTGAGRFPQSLPPGRADRKAGTGRNFRR